MKTHTIGPDCWIPQPMELELFDANGRRCTVYTAMAQVAVPDGEELPAMVMIDQAEYSRLLAVKS